MLSYLHWGLFSLSSSSIFWDVADVWEALQRSGTVMAQTQYLGKGLFLFLTLAGM